MNASRIALVTGGSRGLGKNMALSLARQGSDVIVTYVSKKEDAQAVVSAIEDLGRKAAALPLDVGDIGGVVAFLASEEARWITGQRIEVSGGMFL